MRGLLTPDLSNEGGGSKKMLRRSNQIERTPKERNKKVGYWRLLFEMNLDSVVVSGLAL